MKLKTNSWHRRLYSFCYPPRKYEWLGKDYFDYDLPDNLIVYIILFIGPLFGLPYLRRFGWLDGWLGWRRLIGKNQLTKTAILLVYEPPDTRNPNRRCRGRARAIAAATIVEN